MGFVTLWFSTWLAVHIWGSIQALVVLKAPYIFQWSRAVGRQTIACRVKFSPPSIFINTIFGTQTPVICLHTVNPWFCAIATELSGCDRDHQTHSDEEIFYLALYRKCLQTPVLAEEGRGCLVSSLSLSTASVMPAAQLPHMAEISFFKWKTTNFLQYEIVSESNTF